MVDARLPAEWLGAPRYEDLSDRAFRILAGALMWSNTHGTDGEIPRRCSRLLHPEGDSAEAFAELEGAGFWQATDDGYCLIGWSDALHQSTAAEVERNRANARDRQRRRRAVAVATDVTRDVTHSVPGDVTPDVGSGSRHYAGAERALVTGDVTRDIRGDDEPESPFCSIHPVGTTEPCGGCARARVSLEARDRIVAPRTPWNCDVDGHKLVVDGSCAICVFRGGSEPRSSSVRTAATF